MVCGDGDGECIVVVVGGEGWEQWCALMRKLYGVYTHTHARAHTHTHTHYTTHTYTNIFTTRFEHPLTTH